MVSAAPAWSVLAAPAILLALAVAALAGDALLAARVAGRRLGVAAALGPLRELPRLVVAQRRATTASDRPLWRLGILAVPAGAVLCVLVVPFGRHVVADLDVGVVWFNAMEVATWAGLWLAGWGPNSVFGIIGGYRFVAQGLAYELPLMFALIAPATGARSLRVGDIVGAQRHLWFAVWMPAAFVTFLAGVLAFGFLGPFDYPAGADIAGGVLAETSGVDSLVLRSGRWLLVAAGAAMAVPLFLGGGNGPVLPAWAWSAVKTLGVLGVLVWCRRRLPTIRADRYVEVAWVVLVPVAVAQALAAAIVVLSK